jgi:hypothetical protein
LMRRDSGNLLILDALLRCIDEAQHLGRDLPAAAAVDFMVEALAAPDRR